MKVMFTKISVWLAVCIAIVNANQDTRQWAGNFEQTNYMRHQYQFEGNGQQQQTQNDDGSIGEIYNQTAAYNIDQVIDTILATGRQGRSLDGFDEVYSDPTVQDAIQKGDDSQARNLIKDKLCNLGLMQCENDPKYLPNGELIYAQAPHGSFRPPPPSLHRPPTKVIYGPPKPMPPFSNKFGPPRKVGYATGPGPVYSNAPPSSFIGSNPSSPFLNSGPSPPFINSGPSSSFINSGSSSPFINSGPPSSFIGSAPGPVYHSKPHGSIVDSDAPYKFDSIKEHVISNEEYQALQLGESAPHATKIIANDGITGSSQNSVNIHHHYHHIDGNGADTKAPAVIVNNPIPIGVPIGGASSLTTGESLAHQSISGGFNSLGGAQIQKPVYDGGHQFDSGSNFAGSNFGNSGFGSSGLGSSSSGLYNAGGTSSGLYNGGGSGSFHSSNPDFYKKALKGGNSVNSLNSYNQQFGSGFGGLYSNGQNYQGQESARQDNFDCVCVPFNQCPAQDVLGRKGDLILPLDPRNLGSDIEAFADENNTTVSNSTNARTSSESDDSEDGNSNENGSIEQTEEEVKRISKREVAASDKKSDDLPKADGQARLFGLGSAGVGVGGLGAVGVGLSKKIVEPQFGVSFGLPYPTGIYPTNIFNGGVPAQNPYIGSLSPNGLNLGLVNVNPLVSFQFAKNQFGEKTFKPLVNFHVTPNEHIIQKVGNLLKAKKFGGFGGGSSVNQHYHTHTHYPNPPAVYHPHHFDHHHETYPPTGYAGSEYGFPGSFSSPGFTSPGSYYRDGSTTGNGYETSAPGYYDASPPGNYEFDGSFYSRNSNSSIQSELSQPPTSNYNYQNVYPQNSNPNVNKDTSGYANAFENYKNVQASAAISQAMNGVSFPKRRRKRSSAENDSSDFETETQIQSKARVVEKRQSIYNQIPQQCGPSQVCCRRPAKPYVSPGQCGRRNTAGITGRIKTPVYVDGDSEFGEYPWQVAILKKDPKESVYVCGGTLIDGMHIITAAHCVKTYSGYDLRVRLGEWDVNHDVEFFPYIERDVQSVHVHPEYYAGTLENDLAILKLNAPVDFINNPHISPACLPDKYADFSGTRCWTTGWGKDAFGDFGKYQNILKEVDVPIINQQQCQQQLRNTRLGYNYQLHPGFVCAGGEEGKDACKGDGGGPMVCERNGIWQVVGVVSWGIGCGQVNVPGVYVRVSHYLDWIAQITQQRF